MFEKGQIDIIKLGGEGAKSSGVGQSVVTNVAVVSDQLVIDGANLDGVTKVRITGPSGFDQTFAIESQSGSNLVANGLSNIAFAVGSVFDLILTDAQGAATHQVTFTLQDGAVTASKLDDMGAGVGQVLKYDGTTWGPSDLGALTYAGTWDASSATVPNVSPSAGEYYIVSVAGTGIDLSDGSGSRNFAVGDWLVYNNTTSRWDKIDNATSVTSFNGRNGPITPATNDYTWAQIDKTTSPIGDLSNVNTTGAGVGSVLKFDGTNWVVGTDNTVSAGSVDSSAITDGSIVDADVNASAAIAQSKIANLTTDLAAKVPLAGGTMTGDLTVPNLITSGNVDGVDVSALNTTVGNNSTAIAGKQNTITTGSTAQYLRGDLSLSTFATDARSAAVLNSTAGTETDQAASVAAMKTYVSSQVSGSGSVLDGGNTTGATVVVGTNDAQSLQFETNNTPAMTILNGGNVGIGTTSPSANLEIVGSGYRIGRITSTSSGAALSIDSPPGEQSFLRYESGTSLRWTIGKNTAAESGSNAGSDLAFSRWDDSGGFIGAAMLISRSTGNVSIGTTAPATKLDVEGKITVGPIDATAGNTGAIALEELAANGTNSVTFRAPDSLAANYTLTMPADDGASGQVLSTDGSGVLSWAAAPAATSVSASSGSAATPSMSFSSDPNTGLFSGGADVISFSAGGSEIFSASSSGLVSPTTGGGSVSTANGTASAPTFSFAGDTDTGWFRPAANTLAAATAGSERVRIDASGNVGIGTTSPNKKLHIAASDSTIRFFDTDTNVYSEVGTRNDGSLLFSADAGNTGSSDIVFLNDGSERMRISSSGNVGIGTTSPGAKLQVNNSSGGADIAITADGSSQASLRFNNNTAATVNQFANAPLIINTNNTERMRITQAGNVGIGTTSPGVKLEVTGGHTSIDKYLYLKDYDGAATQSSIISRDENTQFFNGGVVVGTYPDGGIGPLGNGNMVVSGHVGIGATAPGAGLHVMRAADTFDQIRVSSTDGTISEYMFFGVDSTNDLARLGYWDGSAFGDTTILGNVGIGTTTPSSKLEVVADDSPSLLRIRNLSSSDTSGGSSTFQFRNGDDTGNANWVNLVADRDNGYFQFNSGAGYSSYVFSNGNVGIGTTTPAARLDVAGGIKAANDTGTCDASKAGTIRWTGSAFEGCNGTSWTNLSGGGGGSSPTVFSAILNISSSCAILSQVGTYFASGSSVSGSTAVCDYTLSGLSAAPHCTCTSTTSLRHCTTNSLSSSTVRFGRYSTNSGDQRAGTVHVTCVAP